jgi:hypothetical protein
MLVTLDWFLFLINGRSWSLFYHNELCSYLLQAWQALSGMRTIAFLVALSSELVFFLIIHLHLRVIEG